MLRLVVRCGFILDFDTSYSSSREVAGVSAPPTTEVLLLELRVVVEGVSGEPVAVATVLGIRPRRLRLVAGIAIEDENKRWKSGIANCHAFSVNA